MNDDDRKRLKAVSTMPLNPPRYEFLGETELKSKKTGDRFSLFVFKDTQDLLELELYEREVEVEFNNGIPSFTATKVGVERARMRYARDIQERHGKLKP